MKKLDHLFTYRRHLKALKKSHDYKTAMENAVGGSFEHVGRLEVNLLKLYGMKISDYIVDVGCGSGRLAIPLSKDHDGDYLGIDIMPELLDYAKENAKRPEWRFEVADGLKIPQGDSTADIVCFFSVFTHLLHEESFIYLEEAKRVLKSGGKAVFSFLEFAEDGHWHIFEGNIRDVKKNTPLNMFLSREAIRKWAEKLGFTVEDIRGGNERFVPMDPEPAAAFGQSVAVLVRG